MEIEVVVGRARPLCYGSPAAVNTAASWHLSAQTSERLPHSYARARALVGTSVQWVSLTLKIATFRTVGDTTCCSSVRFGAHTQASVRAFYHSGDRVKHRVATLAALDLDLAQLSR